MVIEENHVFNLMDTNGRRKDVLNALKIYLEILEDLKKSHSFDRWESYPKSLTQFLFYQKAIERSKEVFKKHDGYDKFLNLIGKDYDLFIRKDKEWIEENESRFEKVLDEAIEARARHYTSNLVKMGFTDGKRNITDVGYSYMRGNVSKDPLEEFLPLDNINIILLRQLLKLKIFSTPADGKRQYYAPFVMALLVLLRENAVDQYTFEIIVQGLNPYSSKGLKDKVCNGTATLAEIEAEISNVTVNVPDIISSKDDIDFNTFKAVFKNRKSNFSQQVKYYDFFVTLRNFRDNKTESNYKKLVECLDSNFPMLNKAFGYGKNVLNIGKRGSRYNLERFLQSNSKNPLLIDENYVDNFYIAFTRSKWIDSIREYSDTTIRLLGATGLFRFKPTPDLPYKEILSAIFDVSDLRKRVFGEMSEEEYMEYENCENSYFGKNTSVVELFNYSQSDTVKISEKIRLLTGAGDTVDAKNILLNQKSNEFAAYIADKYPKEKIIELLPLFSDRSKDSQIQSEVNDSATVPTIYEYIIGIAWYYISNQEFDLYSSLNLTLNADFEPIIHAGGGEGDIVIDYSDITTMLEVTLMNKQAQKRGEWEPVLRHSLNLKAANEAKETITFFIADELDYNTINIWRAVAAVLLESTDTHTMVDGVVIMPFTNREILEFLERNVYYKDIVRIVKESFSKIQRISDMEWHEEIISNIEQSSQ